MFRQSFMRVGIAMIILLTSGIAMAESPILGPSSTVDDVLDALQASGKDLKTLTATVKSDHSDLTQGTETYRNGKVALNIKPNGDAQLHLVFTDRQFGEKRAVAERKEYILDDGWLTDRDSTTTNEVRRQIARPGEKVNLFQLGKGPFPLPIGQDKKDVHARFDVAIVPVDKDDPANSIHLTLTPKPHTEFADKYKVIDVWVDPKLKMPVRIASTDPKGANIDTNDLTDMKINPPIPPEEFKLPPLEAGWETHDEEK